VGYILLASWAQLFVAGLARQFDFPNGYYNSKCVGILNSLMKALSFVRNPKYKRGGVFLLVFEQQMNSLTIKPGLSLSKRTDPESFLLLFI
jgi:hypothetical protein